MEKDSSQNVSQKVHTEFFEWSCKQFVQPTMRLSDEEDSESPSFLEKQYRFERNCKVRSEAKDEQLKAGNYVFFCVCVCVCVCVRARVLQEITPSFLHSCLV